MVELEVKHLVADVELERPAATRIQEFRLRGVAGALLLGCRTVPA